MSSNVWASPLEKSLRHPKADPEKRSTFCQKIKALGQAGLSVVYLDESGFAHDMPGTDGYSLRPERCWGIHNSGSKGRTNVTGALLGGKLLTVNLFQSTINTAIFNKWVIADLLPKLPPKSVVVLDNASFHKGVDMLKALEDAGQSLLYLPPYSPDLSPPIEKKLRKN